MKASRKTYITPPATLLYADLVKPWIHPVYSKPPGKFSVQCEVTGKAKKLRGVLESVGRQAAAKAHREFTDIPYPGFEEAPDGGLLLRASTVAAWTDKETGKETPNIIPVVDAEGNPLEAEVVASMGQGSKIKVLFEPKPYHMGPNNWGVSIYLNGVIVLEIVETDATGASFAAASDLEDDDDDDEGESEQRKDEPVPFD